MKFFKIKLNINLFTKREKLLLFILFLVLLEISIYLLLENDFLSHKHNIETIKNLNNNLSGKVMKKNLKFLKVEEKNFSTFKNENPNLKIKKINQNTILTEISISNNNFKNLENILNYYKIKKMNFNLLDNENLNGEAHILFKDIISLNDNLESSTNSNNSNTYKENEKSINELNNKEKNKKNQILNKSKKSNTKVSNFNKHNYKNKKNQIINNSNTQKKEKLDTNKKEIENYIDIKLMFSLDFIEENLKNFTNQNSNIKYFISEDFNSIGLYYKKIKNDDLNTLYIPIEKKHYKKLKFQFQSLNKFKGKIGILKDNQIYYPNRIKDVLEFNDINASDIFITFSDSSEENLVFINNIKGII